MKLLSEREMRERNEKYYDKNIYRIQSQLPNGLKTGVGSYPHKIEIYEVLGVNATGNMDLGFQRNNANSARDSYKRSSNNQKYTNGSSGNVTQQRNTGGDSNSQTLDIEAVNNLLKQLESEIENRSADAKMK